MELPGFVTEYWIVPFVVVFGLLVFFHELGHYAIARRNGVRVETFSIGFGPELFGWHDRAGTRWKVSAIPLGGYVKMFGEQDEEDETTAMTPEEQAVSFHHKPLGQRAAIVAAGPIANFLLAIVIFAILFATVGKPRPDAVVGAVLEGSAAEAAGFQVGDVILSIDGEPVPTFPDLQRIVGENPEETLTFRVERGDEILTLAATIDRQGPQAETADEEMGVPAGRGILGVLHGGYERQDPFSASWSAVVYTGTVTWNIIDVIGDMIAGNRSAEELGGPLRIAKLSKDMAENGVASLAFFVALLSINLGLINLLPVPMLDGGHLVFYAAEAVRGRPLDRRTQEYGFRVGLFLVLTLMVFATWNDLVQFEVVDYLRNLVT